MRKAALIINPKGLETCAKSFVVDDTVSKVFRTTPRLTDWGMLWYGKCLGFDTVAGVINRLYQLLDPAKGEYWSLVYVRDDETIQMEGTWRDSPLYAYVSVDICCGTMSAEDIMEEKEKEGKP